MLQNYDNVSQKVQGGSVLGVVDPGSAFQPSLPHEPLVSLVPVDQYANMQLYRSVSTPRSDAPCQFIRQDIG